MLCWVRAWVSPRPALPACAGSGPWRRAGTPLMPPPTRAGAVWSASGVARGERTASRPSSARGRTERRRAYRAVFERGRERPHRIGARWCGRVRWCSLAAPGSRRSRRRSIGTYGRARHSGRPDSELAPGWAHEQVALAIEGEGVAGQLAFGLMLALEHRHMRLDALLHQPGQERAGAVAAVSGQALWH